MNTFNMKKNILSIIFCVLTLISCTKKSDLIFDKTVDERLAETLTNIQAALSGAPGWKLFVYPKGLEESQDIKVGGLTYYVKFTNDNRVTMVSDFLTSIAATPKESGYRLKALQRPSLIFDTYTYMHIPADPDPDVSLSPTGTGGYGWGTDFNFSFKDVTVKDTVYLEGNFNKSSAVLVKATQAEMDAAFKNSRLSNIINFTYAYQAANPFLYFPASPGMNVGLGFDLDNGFTSFSYLEAGKIVNTPVASSFTTYGIHFKTPVTIGSYTFQDMYWDDVKKIYYITSGSTRVEVANSSTPIITLSLTNTIGNQYTTISIPPGAGLPNTSPLFLSKYNLAASGMLSGPYGLSIDKMNFVFSSVAKTMSVNVNVFQGAAGPYLCQYNYTYTVDASGNFKFTKVSQNGNATLIVTNMNNILSYIESDQFELKGYSTSSSFLGQFTSKQTPTFFFSGYLF
jgi:hypothetical protein